MFDAELVKEILSQVLIATTRIERRFAAIKRPEDFTDSEEGLLRLDGIGMILIAIGESLKNLDKHAPDTCYNVTRKLTGKALKVCAMC